MLNNSSPEGKPDPFEIKRSPIPEPIDKFLKSRTLDRSLGGFWPRNTFYQLPFPYDYPSLAVDEIVGIAKERTQLHGGHDDLDYTGNHQPWNPLYEYFRISHAAEHLVIARLLILGVQPPPKIHTAMTISHAALPIDQRIGILFDERVGSSQQLEESVDTVSNNLVIILTRAQSIETSSTSKINVDPGGIEPTPRSP